MIRELQKEDKEMFVTMVKDFYTSEAVLHSIPEEYILGTFDFIIAKSPLTKAFIFEEQGEIVGYALISFTYSNESGGLAVWIDELYIREEFRSLGLGKQFLEFIEKEFTPKAKRVRLEITHSNKAAERLYRRAGFTVLEYKQMTMELEE